MKFIAFLLALLVVTPAVAQSTQQPRQLVLLNVASSTTPLAAGFDLILVKN